VQVYGLWGGGARLFAPLQHLDALLQQPLVQLLHRQPAQSGSSVSRSTSTTDSQRATTRQWVGRGSSAARAPLHATPPEPRCHAHAPPAGIIIRSAREDGGDDTTAAEQEVAEILQHQFAGAGANLAALPPGFAAAAAANGGVQYAGGYVPHYLVFSYPIDAAQVASQPTTVLPLSLETAATQQQVQQLQAAAAQQQAAQQQAAHQAQQAAQAQQQQPEASPDPGQHGPTGQQQAVGEPRQKKRKAGEEEGADEDTA
jgi:hypothetical protein